MLQKFSKVWQFFIVMYLKRYVKILHNEKDGFVLLRPFFLLSAHGFEGIRTNCNEYETRLYKFGENNIYIYTWI